jgi:hypothetical protein
LHQDEGLCRMWRALANPQKDASIRRLTTGGATTRLRV